jgi:tryptophan-rich sensory protein
MSIDSFSEWLSATPLSQFIQVTNGIIPSLQTIHIICVAVLFTGALMVDLRILGSGLRSESLKAVADRFIPPIWVCIAILLVTGSLLIVAEPGRTLSNFSFYVKLVALFFAILVTLWLKGFAQGARPVTGLPVLAAIVSILLWMTIIVAGRYIAYTI